MYYCDKVYLATTIAKTTFLTADQRCRAKDSFHKGFGILRENVNALCEKPLLQNLCFYTFTGHINKCIENTQ